MTNTYGILIEQVEKVKCMPGWKFSIVEKGPGILRLVIQIQGVDSFEPKRPLAVRHFLPVPHTTYNANSWRRWIFEQCRRVMNHELGEWLRFSDEGSGPDVRPFLPLHGPGEDPYTVHEFRPEADALTTQDGSIREKD